MYAYGKVFQFQEMMSSQQTQSPQTQSPQTQSQQTQQSQTKSLDRANDGVH